MKVNDLNMINYRNQDPVVPKKEMELKRLQKACRDFEAIFIKQMLNSMRKTVKKSSLINRNMAEDIFEDMLYDEYSSSMSKTANLGLSKLMYNNLKDKL